MDLIRRSSSIGRMVVHVSFKVKYCHEVFDFPAFRGRCAEIFREVADKYKITIIEMGFDRDHVHMILEIGLHSIVDVYKWFKGASGRKLLHEFPDIKREYFWGSGLWNPAPYFDSVGERTSEDMGAYVRNQGGPRNTVSLDQQTLANYL